MNDRGSAFLAVVTTIVVLLLISGIIFKTLIANYKLESSEEKALRAYYLAEAGIQYGLAVYLQNEKNLGGVNKKNALPTSPQTIENPFGQGGRFTVIWEDQGNHFTVTSTGEYSGVIRKKQAGYKYLEEEEGG